VAIVGCGGSGKTTLARALAARTRIDVVHLDSLYLARDGCTPSPEAWAATQCRLVRGDAWIIEGNYASSIAIRLAAADTVVHLDLSTRACLAGILRRRLRHRGRSAPETGVHDRVNRAFLRFVWSFRRTRREALIRLIEQHAPQATVIRLTSRRDVRRFVCSIPLPTAPT
jgi:adenylate kinase family enzyme